VIRPTDLFHIGIVVPDLEKAQRHFTDAYGFKWLPSQAPTIAYTDESGTRRQVVLSAALSVGDPVVELIEQIEGTVWTVNPSSNLHHLCFWAEDLDRESQRLVSSGCPVELARRAEEGTPPEVLFNYHADPLGVRIELVSAALRDTWESAITSLGAGTG
jgi:catechol 2,3-dioxygenase-like lactoylglutathione lyase family enzyme